MIEHAQVLFPDGGGVMLGSSSRPSNPFSDRPTGSSSAYVVTQDIDQLFRRAVDAGATVFQPINEADHGSRGFSVLDPEGNLWSFGTYGGES